MNPPALTSDTAVTGSASTQNGRSDVLSTSKPSSQTRTLPQPAARHAVQGCGGLSSESFSAFAFRPVLTPHRPSKSDGCRGVRAGDRRSLPLTVEMLLGFHR